jgi:hypothetical protein
MCSICLQYPCDVRCPNARPNHKRVIKICYECGEEIDEGEEYYALNGEDWCVPCVKDGLTIAEIET